MAYNKFFNKEKWQQVNKYNKNMLDDFLLELRSKRRSDGTISQYKNDLRILFIYIFDELDNEKISSLKKKQFRNYSIYLQDLGLSSSRVNRLLSSLRSMLDFAESDDDYQDDISFNYASKVKGLQKEQVREIIFLEDSEIQLIYDALIEQEKYKQALLCAIMYDTASRRNEVFQIKSTDIVTDSNLCQSEIIGKGRKKYRPIFQQRTKEAHERLIKSGHTNDLIWVGDNGIPLSYETLYSWVIGWRKILKDKGIDKLFNAHSFRHSALENYSDGSHYVTQKLGNKITLTSLKTLANHNDISTTQSYLKDKSKDELLKEFGI